MSKKELNGSVQNAKDSVKGNADYWLYFSIAFLTVFVSWPDPVNWRCFAAATVAGLTALKAKRSSATGEDDPQEVMIMNKTRKQAVPIVEKPPLEEVKEDE